MYSENLHCKIQCGCTTRYNVVTYLLPIRRSIQLHSESVRTVTLWLPDKINTWYYKDLILRAASERVDHSIRGVQPDVCV
jgi:hypothetical protein